MDNYEKQILTYGFVLLMTIIAAVTITTIVCEKRQQDAIAQLTATGVSALDASCAIRGTK